MILSLVYSWMQWCSRGPLFSLTGLLLAVPVHAEGDVIRLGRDFRDVAGFPMLEQQTVAEVLDRENLGVKAYVMGTDSCQKLLAIPKGSEPGYDKTQMTYTIITTIKVECWVLSQVDPSAKVAPMEESDRLSEQVVEGIRAFGETLPGELDLWPEVLIATNDAKVGCNGHDRCALSAPEESEWAGYTMHFRLVLADGERKFIAVTEAYEGRRGFVFGVIWSDSAGRVLEMFPILE